MDTYIWCEDSGSGFVFWKLVFNSLYKGFIIESKMNNTELCKAVSKLKAEEENRYYILMDNAIDNPDVLRETIRLKQLAENHHCVSIIRIHSFEFVLLSFQMLEEWVFAKEADDFKEQFC